MVKRMMGRVGMTLTFLLIAVVMFTGPSDSASAIRSSGDLDGDRVKEEYSLKGGSLIVTEGERTLWESPDGWYVDSFCLGDADNDGSVNLVFSLWKEGSFGDVKPFWHDGEDFNYKNHLFVYKLEGDLFRPVWCSSDLDRPIISFAVMDQDRDGLNELVVREGKYIKVSGETYRADPGADVQSSVWQWDQWGFKKIKELSAL